MSYNITNADGSVLLVLADGQTDTVSASITFVGKNVSKFGEIQNNNFLHILENFANVVEPPNKLTGQLWFDKANNLLKVNNNSHWQTLAVLSYSTSTSGASSTSNLWYDTDNNQLFINKEGEFVLIGPEKAPGYNPTKLISVTLKDTTDNTHPVIEALVDDRVMYVVSGSDFVTSSTNLIPGISHIRKGITLKNGDIAGNTDATLTGTSLYATNANALLNEDGDAYLLASTTAMNNTIVQRNSSGGFSAIEINVSNITSSAGTISGPWTVATGFNPDTNGGANLGTSGLRWSGVYSQNVDSTSINANTIKFSNLTDYNLLSILQFDDDATMAANSHQRLPTQFAVKHYVDARLTPTDDKVNSLPPVSIPAVATTLVERTPQGGIIATDIAATSITAVTGTIAGTWTVNNGFNPDTNGGANLGTSNLRWSAVYSQAADLTNITASSVNAASVQFNTLVDNSATSIVKFDDDPKLAANSHQRLPTQYAVKTYVDTTATWLYNLIEAIPIISVPADADSLVHRDGSGGIAASNVNATSIKMTASTSTINFFDTDVALAANSNARLATQRAIKTYVDTLIANEVASRVSGDNNLQNAINAIQAIPTGTVFYTAGSAVPSGYLEAAGQTLTIAAYPALYAALGGAASPYGITSTTFNLPDLRGQFVRGWDHGRGVDAGRTLGSTQADDFKSHQHIGGWGEAWAGPFGQTGEAGHTGSAKTDNDNYLWNTNFVGGTETRPKNIALMAIIKY
jgi:hypothetical protein